MKRKPIPPEQWVFRDVAVGDWVTRFGDLLCVSHVTPKFFECGHRHFRRDTGEGGRCNPGTARPAAPAEVEAHERWSRGAADKLLSELKKI